MRYPLNAEQRCAVETIDGPIVCISGPGSGKTTVIVERYLNLLQRGVVPDSIMTLTFTQNAAKEMADRAGFASAPVFRTFHSFALSLLKKERGALPFVLTPEILPLPNDIYQTMIHLLHTYRAIPSYKSLAEGISLFKHRGLTPDQAREESYGDGIKFLIASAYRDYERICRENGWLDFDSVMGEAVRLLEENPQVRERNQFDFLQVDEGQDTDNTQFRMLQALTKRNIFIVGDENQLIYEWRSAMPGSLSQFSQKFSNAKTLYLGTNYRSTRSLVRFLKQILPVDNGLASHMKPSEGSPEGISPTITKYEDDGQEAERILSSITDPENSAILARTNRQLEIFRQMCVKKGVKFRFLGKSGFWDQSEVKALVKIIKEDKHRYSRVNASDAVRIVVERSGITEKYRTQWKFGDSDPQENINTVCKIAARFETVDAFLSYVTKLTHANRNKTGLILSTVHQMKGKEAAHVYLVGANNGVLPHKNGELPEEQRIFYVACSRAAKLLHISYYGPPSMFIVPFLKETQTIQDMPGAQQVLF